MVHSGDQMTTIMYSHKFLAEAATAVPGSLGRTPANECLSGDVPALAGRYAR